MYTWPCIHTSVPITIMYECKYAWAIPTTHSTSSMSNMWPNLPKSFRVYPSVLSFVHNWSWSAWFEASCQASHQNTKLKSHNQNLISSHKVLLMCLELLKTYVTNISQGARVVRLGMYTGLRNQNDEESIVTSMRNTKSAYNIACKGELNMPIYAVCWVWAKSHSHNAQ